MAKKKTSKQVDQLKAQAAATKLSPEVEAKLAELMEQLSRDPEKRAKLVVHLLQEMMKKDPEWTAMLMEAEVLAWLNKD